LINAITRMTAKTTNRGCVEKKLGVGIAILLAMIPFAPITRGGYSENRSESASDSISELG
jgi:hypothetical protein